MTSTVARGEFRYMCSCLGSRFTAGTPSCIPVTARARDILSQNRGVRVRIRSEPTRSSRVDGSDPRKPRGEQVAEIQCARCGRSGEPLPKAPLRNELGERIHASICRSCWDEWLRFQTMLINHNGLDVRDKPA